MSYSMNRPERPEDQTQPAGLARSPSPQDRPAPVLSGTEARQGVTTGRLRWILGVSLALAIIAMIVVAWA